MNHFFKSNISIKHQQGFTLIEVLVASFILFLVIAATTLVYRGAILSSQKAERTLQFSTMVEPITEQIRPQIQASTTEVQLQGNGAMGEIVYNWTAIQSQRSKAPLILNVGTGEFDDGDKIFRLWDVSLILQYKNARREYLLSEVSW